MEVGVVVAFTEEPISLGKSKLKRKLSAPSIRQLQMSSVCIRPLLEMQMSTGKIRGVTEKRMNCFSGNSLTTQSTLNGASGEAARELRKGVHGNQPRGGDNHGFGSRADLSMWEKMWT